MADRLEMSEDDLIQLSLLRDFETDELINAGFLSEDERLTAPLDKELTFKYEELSLRVTAGSSYPATPVCWTVDNYILPIKVVDDLRGELRRIVEASTANNNISRWRKREEECDFGIFEPTMVVLELAKETKVRLELWRLKTASDDPVEQEVPFQKKPLGSLLTSSDIAYHYLQQTPQEICARIPSCYRILHVEEILRNELARKFHNKQEKMRTELSMESHAALRASVPPYLQHTKRKEVIVEHLLEPHVTFHGTARQLVPSIVRYGFLQPGKANPGTGKSHDVRCGSTYGRGIYSSPSADFSLSYTGSSCHATKPNEFFGIKLFACATLMGRTAHVTRDDDWRGQSQPYPGADSHIANRNLEYVVFDTAQILPVYVIHIDWGQDNALHFAGLPVDPGRFVPSQTRRQPKLVEDVRFPGDVQREKAAALARAAKYFPYGFGPATGGRFVVEEIGEVDEDEEEYGEYQALRGEDIKDKTNLDFWSWVKVGEEMDAAAGSDGNPDEYSNERIWHGLDRTAPKWDEIPDPRGNDEKEREDEGDESEDNDDGLGLDRLMI
ncbi:ADP-ribosylation [Hypoxylon sp. FL1150]|nr:ADP-ribosylation [Hypoxylon sp. FL1150]